MSTEHRDKRESQMVKIRLVGDAHTLEAVREILIRVHVPGLRFTILPPQHGRRGEHLAYGIVIVEQPEPRGNPT
jgi:hypothetical protein